MQTPPPFNPQVERPMAPPPPKAGTNLILILLAVFGGFCCLLMVGVGVTGWRMMGPLMSTASCGMTLGFNRAAIDKYVEKYGKYPDADKWQDQIEPFYAEISKKLDKQMEKKDNAAMKQFFKIPDPKAPMTCDSGKMVTGFAYNDEISGKKKEDVKDGKTVMLFEVTKVERNAHAKYNPNESFSGPELFGQKRERFTVSVKGHSKSDFTVFDDDEEDTPSKGDKSKESEKTKEPSDEPEPKESESK